MEEKGKITVYDSSMAKKIAKMFNDFNEIWPGGFTGGIPYDENRVRDLLDKTSAIADLIALDSEDNPVGYCGLYPHWRDGNAAYISILGVHPKVVGQKFGKRLLLKALAVAKEKGIFRVDLHTWSGNMEAMPLYKKIGLFWVPETSVYMQDYIPGILQNPLAKEWFEKHPDWYSCFQRKLTQSPDKEVNDGMEVFTYNFEVGEDKLSMEVDRYGWGFSGIERVLDGNKISIKSRLESHYIIMGIENSLSYKIENISENDVELELTVVQFKGLKWLENLPSSITIKKGETITVSSSFIIDSTSRKHKSSQRSSEVIETNFSFNSYEIKLTTGGKIHPAIELQSSTEYINTPLGIEKKVYVDLKNYSNEHLSGKILIHVDGINVEEEIDFSIQPDEITGIEIPLAIPKDTKQSIFTLHATPIVRIKENEFSMPKFNLPLVANRPGIAEVIQGPDENKLTLITDYWAIRIRLERANIFFSRRYVEDTKVRSSFEIGPPYGLDLDRTLKYDYEVRKNGNELTLILKGNSLQVKGLRIIKHIRVAPGVKEVEHWIELENIEHQGSIAAGGKVNTTSAGGLNVNPIGNFAKVYTPIYNKYIECDPTFPVMSQNLVSDKPEDWNETWTAGKLMGEANISAIIWDPNNIEKIKINQGFLYDLESKQTLLKSGEKISIVHLWYAHSYSSLREVRTRWNQLIGQKEMSYEESLYGVQTTAPIVATLKDSNILRKGKTIQKIIEILAVTPYPLPGKLSLILPDKWKGFFVTPDGKQQQIEMSELVPNSKIPVEIELTIPDDTLKSSDIVRLHLSGEFEMDFDLAVILKGSSEVRILEEKIEEQEVLVVENGNLRFKVPKNIGGDLIQLEDSEGNSFLLDSFPKVGSKFFVEHYLGGIQPAMFHTSEENPFAELESTETEEVSEGEWVGVKTTWINEKSEILKGQKYSISYLTLPDSNIIRIKIDNVNETPRKVSTIAAMIADIALKGETSDNVIRVPGGMKNWIRNRVQKPFINQTNMDEPWVRIEKEEVSLSFMSALGFFGSNTIFDSQVMLINILLSMMETEPYQTSTNEFIIMINQPEEAIEEVRKGLAKNQY